MHYIKFTPRGQRDLKKLNPHLKKRITKKLDDYSKRQNPFEPSRPLIDLPPATHRYRVGKYRIYFFIKGKIIFVERVEIRGKAYRR